MAEREKKKNMSKEVRWGGREAGGQAGSMDDQFTGVCGSGSGRGATSGSSP